MLDRCTLATVLESPSGGSSAPKDISLRPPRARPCTPHSRRAAGASSGRSAELDRDGLIDLPGSDLDLGRDIKSATSRTGKQFVVLVPSSPPILASRTR